MLISWMASPCIHSSVYEFEWLLFFSPIPQLFTQTVARMMLYCFNWWLALDGVAHNNTISLLPHALLLSFPLSLQPQSFIEQLAGFKRVVEEEELRETQLTALRVDVCSTEALKRLKGQWSKQGYGQGSCLGLLRWPYYRHTGSQESSWLQSNSTWPLNHSN